MRIHLHIALLLFVAIAWSAGRSGAAQEPQLPTAEELGTAISKNADALKEFTAVVTFSRGEKVLGGLLLSQSDKVFMVQQYEAGLRALAATGDSSGERKIYSWRNGRALHYFANTNSATTASQSRPEWGAEPHLDIRCAVFSAANGVPIAEILDGDSTNPNGKVTISGKAGGLVVARYDSGSATSSSFEFTFDTSRGVRLVESKTLFLGKALYHIKVQKAIDLGKDAHFPVEWSFDQRSIVRAEGAEVEAAPKTGSLAGMTLSKDSARMTVKVHRFMPAADPGLVDRIEIAKGALVVDHETKQKRLVANAYHDASAGTGKCDLLPLAFPGLAWGSGLASLSATDEYPVVSLLSPDGETALVKTPAP